MNKADLINEVAKVVSSKKDAKAAVDCIFESITATLKKKKTEPVTLIGFGTFKVNKRKARMGRNPKTGEAMTLPERRVVTFKVSRVLKERVNGAHKDRDTG